MPAKGESTTIWCPHLGFQQNHFTVTKLFVQLFAVLLPFVSVAQQPASEKRADTMYLQPIEVSSIRANANAPFAKTNLSANDLRKNNLGADLPVLLSSTPSAVFTSDAGNGIGYTGIRIRGTDASRINVTINGIPYNDAESQGTFFVNLPDFTSSANSIQIQRGVGTSSNGAGAFGATVNLATNELQTKPYMRFSNSAGSFNSYKHTVQFGSGLIGKHISMDGRFSKISSDGYVDRAFSDLRAGYGSLAWTDAQTSVRFNIFTGDEKTYQAWNGIPEALLKTNRTFNPLGLEQPGSPYANQTDNYRQTHYQLFVNQKLNSNWTGNLALFLTRGKGYYEEYRADQDFTDYRLSPWYNGTSLITSTDLIRQLWLDNYFYGTTWSFQHKKNNTQITLGGAFTKYEGRHYGIIKWAAVKPAVPANFRWYDLPATKSDFSVYSKWTEQWAPRWSSYFDLQYRHVDYTIDGFRKNPDIRINRNFNFFNPKMGLVYAVNNWKYHASMAVASKEPNRDDFESATTETLKPETLIDWELGVEKRSSKFTWNANAYYMRYVNQLILTGKINDVGAYTRTNIPNSYRLGLELEAKWQPATWTTLSGNLTLSENKVLDFTEFIDDYDNGGQVTNTYKKSTISFSPALTGSLQWSITPLKGAEILFSSRYVSRQYLDNTGKTSRSINPYYVQDARFSYQIASRKWLNPEFIIQVNNVLNKKYESNGYSFSYIYGGLTTENYYFPMATRNIMAGINISL